MSDVGKREATTRTAARDRFLAVLREFAVWEVRRDRNRWKRGAERTLRGSVAILEHRAFGILSTQLVDERARFLPFAPNRVLTIVVVGQRRVDVCEGNVRMGLDDLVWAHTQMFDLACDQADLDVRVENDGATPGVVDVRGESSGCIYGEVCNRSHHRQCSYLVLQGNSVRRGAGEIDPFKMGGQFERRVEPVARRTGARQKGGT